MSPRTGESIYHIAEKRAWENALLDGQYFPAESQQEGFIHFSTEAQVLGTANLLFHGQRGLMLLRVDPSLLTAELKYEALGEGQRFPHLYGPLNLDAVKAIAAFEPDVAGEFSFPFEESPGD